MSGSSTLIVLRFHLA